MATSNLEKVIMSFKKMLNELDNLDCFVYTESSIDLEAILRSRTKVDLPLGTETSFIVQFYEDNNWWDLIGTTQKYDVFKRYIKIQLPSNDTVTKLILIEDYNNATGEITLAEPFGEAITTSDEFEIVVLDSIFLRDQNFQDAGNSTKFNEKFFRLYMDIKTKDDSNRTKNRFFQELISARVGQYYNLEIYDDDLTTQLGWMRFDDNGTYAETVDSSEQLIIYVGNVAVRYYQNNFG